MSKSDTYMSIASPSEGLFKDNGSRFIALAYPVESEEEVKQIVSQLKKEYHDARHHCYAFRLGKDGQKWRASDDGEPSGSAGRPILGQIDSLNLSDILVVVVRYFGGIKLGTGGLIVAYKTAAAQALAEADIIEKTVDDEVCILFEYPFMNDVMRIVKEESPEIVEQSYDMDCVMRLRIRRSALSRLRSRLEKVDSLRFADTVGPAEE